MKEEKSGGKLFCGCFITVYGVLTVVTAVWMDTDSMGLTVPSVRLSPLIWRAR